MSPGFCVDHGYTVLEAGCGTEALELLAEAPRVDLLVTDVVLPGMSGRELAETVGRLAPRGEGPLHVGLPADAIVLSGRLEPGITLLEKPFTPDALARHVREVLDSSSG